MAKSFRLASSKQLQTDQNPYGYYAQQGAPRIHNRIAQSAHCEPRWPGRQPVGTTAQAFSPQGACWINGQVTQVAEPTAPTRTAWTVDYEGNTHFTLTSNGFTREQWEQHLESRGWRIGDYARQVLRRASEAPTNGVTYNIVVSPGEKISDNDRITRKIRAAADKKGWVKPHWEVACLIRDTFTDEQLEQMGLWYIVTMHEPVKDSVGVPDLLYSSRHGDGRWLHAYYGRPVDGWSGGGGFAFAVPQVGPQT